MSNVDVTIYKVVKKAQPIEIESDILKQFDCYTVDEEHFSEVRDLLDFGRESHYNSQLSSSNTIFIDDELGAYKLAHELNLEEYNKLLQFINNALQTPILDNSTRKKKV